MNELELIEQRFNFKYPGLYRRLYSDRMLDWMHGWNESWTKERNWGNTIYPALVDNPPLLLFAHDFEILPFNRITKEIEAFIDPLNCGHTGSEYQFVPFAGTGGGDLYAFQFGRQYNGNVPVAFIPRDDESITILAKNLQDFIFRFLLEMITDINQYSKITEGDFKANRTNILKSHKPYLPPKQFEKLAAVYGKQLSVYKHRLPNGNGFATTGLISQSELSEILVQEIGFEDLDKEFVYLI